MSGIFSTFLGAWWAARLSVISHSNFATMLLPRIVEVNLGNFTNPFFRMFTYLTKRKFTISVLASVPSCFPVAWLWILWSDCFVKNFSTSWSPLRPLLVFPPFITSKSSLFYFRFIHFTELSMNFTIFEDNISCSDDFWTCTLF